MDDFEFSVDRFVEALDADPSRRAQVLRRWRERSWTIRKLRLCPAPDLFPSPTLYPGHLSVSSATAMVSLDPD